MITISPPHAALNDPRQHKRFRMRYSYVVGATESVADMAARLDRAASLTPRGVLANVVVCAHGSPDSVQLGAGLTRSSVAGFSSIRGKVRKIWLTSCRTASTSTPGRSLPAQRSGPGMAGAVRKDRRLRGARSDLWTVRPNSEAGAVRVCLSGFEWQMAPRRWSARSPMKEGPASG